VGPTDPINTETIARYMKKYGLKKIGVVAATDASGEVGVSSVKSVFPAAGIPYTLDRIDLRANDASIQLSKVVQPGVDIIYVYYSGGGAATVVKSYANLGLTQPLVLNYANMTDQFLTLIKDDMPRHLLGTALKAISPELLTDPAERARTTYFTHAYEEWKHEKADELNIAALGLADTVEAVLRNVPNPRDAKAVKAYLESTPIHSFQTIRFSPTSHVGFTANDVALVEYKDGRWVEAGPLQ
jgi:ABC-type branched-subunit amino acid transport system substrate-binding protein